MKELEKKSEKKPAIRYTSLRNSLKTRQFTTENSDLLEEPSGTSLMTRFATGKNSLK
jgi:hypothetical protein